MSARIDPREVLTYLNELGYTNINAQQLKDFIKDLKKLMKFESRYIKDRENINLNINEEMDFVECECEPEGAIYEPLYNQPTIASKAKEVPRKEKQISVQITKKKTRIDHPHCVHVLSASNKPEDSSKIKLVKNSDVSEFTTESTTKSMQPSTATSKRSSSKESKSRVTFIRPAISKPSINKCDPVALYHHYQREWQKVKIPGQDSRADLRWAIRERMLGEPKLLPRCTNSRRSFR